MQKLNEFLLWLDQYIGGHQWFVYFLLGTGLFFTLYLGFPQLRYFKHAIRIIKGKFDKKEDVGDTSHFQALTTALSGTIGTGNIAGVALAIHLGGPAALFWMLVTALFGMTLKFVEVTISHKYRDILPDGSVSGGPMYYMKKKLNIKTKSGKVLKTGAWLGGFFAFATILSSFGTGNLPQINSISDSIFDTFGLNKIITGAILAVLLGAVIIGGIKRIAKVTSTLVPAMAIIYILGALFVISTNYENIIPSFVAVFRDAFSGSAAVGGFLGAGFAFTFNRGVNRGLFSNEAGQGSAPIAHSAAKAEPVSEGMVALLGPFIDTIIICTITGLVLLSSGVWNEKIYNKFEDADLEILAGSFSDQNPEDVEILSSYNFKKDTLLLYTGTVHVKDGKLQDELTFFHAGSIAEEMEFRKNNKAFTGSFNVEKGKIVRELPQNSDGSRKSLFSQLNHENDNENIVIWGKSLIHSAPLTTEAFKRSFLGDFGQYIVSIGLLLFAFSTAISWSYYGDRAVTYLFGSRWVMVYRMIYVAGFFFAAFTDTTIVWNFSLITIAIMTVPNLFGLLILHKDLRKTIHEYWITIKENFPDAKVPRRYR